MTIHNTKHISKYEGSPCLNCLVSMTCTRSMLHPLGACQPYKDFVLEKINDIKENKEDANQERFRN